MAITPFSDRIKELERDIKFEKAYIEILKARGTKDDKSIISNLKPKLSVKEAELATILSFK